MVEFPITKEAPREARRWISESEAGLSPDEVDVLTLLVSELVSNSVLHSGADPTERVQVTAERRGRAIRVHVQDPGPGFEMGASVEGHFGLGIVDAAATRWGVDRSPTSVWFEIDVGERRSASGREA